MLPAERGDMREELAGHDLAPAAGRRELRLSEGDLLEAEVVGGTRGVLCSPCRRAQQRKPL